MDIPLIRRFELGYRSGAQAINPKIKVFANYVGAGSDAWRNPTKGKELALAQYGKGVDIIFCAAGSSGMGVFDAAEEEKKFAIGVDSNQNWVKPGRILTSMVKGVDFAVYQAIELEKAGKFQGGLFSLGLKEDAIGFAVDEYNRKILSPETESKAKAIRQQIIDGKISVPDFYKLKK